MCKQDLESRPWKLLVLCGWHPTSRTDPKQSWRSRERTTVHVTSLSRLLIISIPMATSFRLSSTSKAQVHNAHFLILRFLLVMIIMTWAAKNGGNAVNERRTRDTMQNMRSVSLGAGFNALLTHFLKTKSWLMRSPHWHPGMLLPVQVTEAAAYIG